MRVLHVLEAVGGGTMRHLEDLVAHTFIDHHVACPLARVTDLSHPDPTGALRSAGATVHTIPMSRKLLDRSNLRAIRELARLIDDVKPDVIHAHASVAGALARVSARRRVPVIWAPHAVHNRRWALRVERRLRPLADVVVTLSPSEAHAAVDSGLALYRQVRVIPNGVATPVSSIVRPSRQDLGVPQDVPVIGFIGRFCDQKAPLDFVETARHMLTHNPNLHAVMVGSGPLLAEVLAAAADLPSDRFHHKVCDAGADRHLGAFDVLITPSLYEGGPYLPLEAMHAGVPVVATDCAGLRDYVVDSVSGLSVKVGDVRGLVRAAESVLYDSLLRTRLVSSARRFVELHHDIARMARSYEQLYLELAPSANLTGMPHDIDVHVEVSPARQVS